MPVGLFGGFAATWGTLYEAFHYQERLIDFLQGAFVFANGSCNSLQTDWTATELLDDCKQNLVVLLVKSILVNVEC